LSFRAARHLERAETAHYKDLLLALAVLGITFRSLSIGKEGKNKKFKRRAFINSCNRRMIRNTPRSN
jgi:hypothetical protein